MKCMRTPLFLATLAVATPAAAQLPSTGDQILLDDLRARQEAAERRAVEQANRLMALEARLQAQRAIQDLQAQGVNPPVPRLPYEPSERGRSSARITFPSIPDEALAASNRRVQEASRNRR